MLEEISSKQFCNENDYIKDHLKDLEFINEKYSSIKNKASSYIDVIKNNSSWGMEQFLQKYNLNDNEGVAIMSLAESLLRVSDNYTAIKLITDKLSGGNWSRFIEGNNSLMLHLISVGLISASSFSSLEKHDNLLSKIISKLGSPFFIKIVKQSMRYLSNEFILGSDMNSALSNTKKYPDFKFSFDLLGESARNMEQAQRYYGQYVEAIDLIAKFFPGEDNIYDRPSLSVKLTALYPRIELLKEDDIENDFMPRLIDLVKKCRDKKISISFDAEEAFRLDIYLKILTILVEDPNFADFHGIGFVVQAYQKRSFYVLDYIIALSKKTNKLIPTRLVKGAYWDSEIKIAAENGLEDFSVFTKKDFTDFNYILCAKKY